MGKLTVALVNESDSQTAALVESLAANAEVGRVLLIDQGGEQPALRAKVQEKARVLKLASPRGAGFAKVLDAVETDYVLFFSPGEPVSIGRLSDFFRWPKIRGRG